MEATIVAAKVFRPKPGKKRWTIVTPDETLYGAMPDVAGKFREGGTYNIFYKEDHFGGKTYLVIEGATEVAGAPQPAVATATSAPAYSGGKYGAKDDETAERILCCGALNAVLNNPGLDPLKLTTTEVIGFITMFRDSWAATFGSKNDDMGGDRIPF